MPYPVQVTAPDAHPVVGAQVDAQVTTSAHVPIGAVMTATTGSDGVAPLMITTPITPTDYLVRASVGDAVSFMPLKLLTMPITVALTVDQVAVDVADAAVPLTVTVEAGGVISPEVPLPLLLTTDLGSFANRSSTASFDITGFAFAGEFYPGTVAGDAHIQASVGGYSATAAAADQSGCGGTHHRRGHRHHALLRWRSV